MGMLDSFFHPNKGYDAAQKQLDKYYQQAQAAQRPYQQNGLDQYGNMNQYIQNAMNPQQLEDNWASGYTESEEARNARDTAMAHGMDASSAMGLGGSNSALNAIQNNASRISLDDRKNYLDRLMQKYTMGANLSSGIYGQGAGAANQMSNNANTMGQNSAAVQEQRVNSPGSMFSSLLGTALPGIGSMLSGPIGGAMSSWMTKAVR